jgi:hypothetical protein
LAVAGPNDERGGVQRLQREPEVPFDLAIATIALVSRKVRGKVAMLTEVTWTKRIHGLVDTRTYIREALPGPAVRGERVCQFEEYQR